MRQADFRPVGVRRLPRRHLPHLRHPIERIDDLGIG